MTTAINLSPTHKYILHFFRPSLKPLFVAIVRPPTEKTWSKIKALRLYYLAWTSNIIMFAINDCMAIRIDIDDINIDENKTWIRNKICETQNTCFKCRATGRIYMPFGSFAEKCEVDCYHWAKELLGKRSYLFLVKKVSSKTWRTLMGFVIITITPPLPRLKSEPTAVFTHPWFLRIIFAWFLQNFI